jgi:hypothetical protein
MKIEISNYVPIELIQFGVKYIDYEKSGTVSFEVFKKDEKMIISFGDSVAIVNKEDVVDIMRLL